MGALVDAVIGRWFTPAGAERDPGMVRPVRERFLAIDPHGYAVCCGAIRDMDLRPQLAAIAAPTLIIAGADDPATPVAMMEDIRARLPGAELVVVPRAAHLVAIEQAAIVNSYLRSFLDRLEMPTGPRAGISGVINPRLGDLLDEALGDEGAPARHSRRGSRTASACSAPSMSSVRSRRRAPSQPHGRISSRASPGARSGAIRRSPGRRARW